MKTLAGERTREDGEWKRETIVWNFMGFYVGAIQIDFYLRATCSSVQKSMLCARRPLCLRLIESSLHCSVVFAESKQKTNQLHICTVSIYFTTTEKKWNTKTKIRDAQNETRHFVRSIKMYEQIKVETKKPKIKTTHQSQQRRRLETISEYDSCLSRVLHTPHTTFHFFISLVGRSSGGRMVTIDTVIPLAGSARVKCFFLRYFRCNARSEIRILD